MSVGCDEGPWVWGRMVWDGWMDPTAIFSVSWSGGPDLIPTRGCVRRSPYAPRPTGRTIRRSTACLSTPPPVLKVGGGGELSNDVLYPPPCPPSAQL